jgi:hypothetical protein
MSILARRDLLRGICGLGFGVYAERAAGIVSRCLRRPEKVGPRVWSPDQIAVFMRHSSLRRSVVWTVPNGPLPIRRGDLVYWHGDQGSPYTGHARPARRHGPTPCAIEDFFMGTAEIDAQPGELVSVTGEYVPWSPGTEVDLRTGPDPLGKHVLVWMDEHYLARPLYEWQQGIPIGFSRSTVWKPPGVVRVQIKDYQLGAVFAQGPCSLSHSPS